MLSFLNLLIFAQVTQCLDVLGKNEFNFSFNELKNLGTNESIDNEEYLAF